ncbi:MAG: TolC family protein [Siphonobacter sp.]
MKTKIVLFILAALPLTGISQNQASWSLKECIAYGLKNYGTVRIAQFKKETANHQAREAVSQYLPQVSGTGTFTDNLKLQKNILEIAGQDPVTLTFGTKYQINLAAQATQAIYDKTLLLGIKANEPNKKLADLSDRQTQEDIIYNVTKNYYQVFVSQQQISLLKDNLARTEQVLTILKLQRDNGVIQPVDYTNTEVSYNNTRSQLTLAENTYQLSINQLRYQMGLSQDEPMVLSDTAILKKLPQPEKVEFDAGKLVSVQQAETNLVLQRINAERTKAGYLPTLGFTANYGTLAFDNAIDGVFKNYKGFGSIGLKLTVPIFDGLRRDAQYQQNKLTVLTQQEQLKLNTASYHLQYRNAESQLLKSQTNTQNDQRNVQLAQRVYDITTLQYKQGVKTLTDLLNADKSYRDAQSNYINSLISYYQAQLDLEQSQGSLLNFYNQL